ncbi:alpha/beta fold hydrolase [Winogradskyella maritima]|uniref:Alpha/beta hydrolase n=1 Tax=Winogradskyella maritima TaxID=1517766 RepID=A0ABV8AIP4_9FLAO|nr:alpha/beta fold hydrolase [Winogradskyella maritima]
MPTTLEEDFEYQFQTPFEELWLTAEDGARLNGVHFKSETKKGVILYFHGNAGDLSRWGAVVEPFTNYGYDVVVMDYRTYGKSSGVLSEKNLYEDAQLFYDYVSNVFPAENIIIYGRSLGTGIASHLASKNPAKQLILETPYTSITDVAKHRFPMFPVKSLLKYHFPTNENLKHVHVPITIFHGTDDSVVPYKFGKQLKDSFPNKIKLITIENGEHNNLVEFEGYKNGIDALLSKAL